MTREELLDHFAINAMNSQIEKFGITNPHSLAQTAYRVAQEMLDNRNRIIVEWKREEEQKIEYETSDIHELNIPIRYYRCLIAENIHSKKKLCEWIERDIKRIPNLGPRGLKYLKEAMAQEGLKFKGQI